MVASFPEAKNRMGLPICGTADIKGESETEERTGTGSGVGTSVRHSGGWNSGDGTRGPPHEKPMS